MDKKTIYLFSIDLEDVRFRMTNGMGLQERITENTHKYLNWLQKYNFKCTFFTVGDVARTFPELIKEIVSEGHEIACHSNNHIALNTMTLDEFKRDLIENKESLLSAGAKEILGFRAPYFSLTKECDWVYGTLKELGFEYSSSIYPASNPFYGWKEFGNNIKTMEDSIIEIPMTVGSFGPIKAAYAGGVYFRVLPKFLIYSKFNKHLKTNSSVLGYFHPYDIDTSGDKFMHPEINNSRFYNWLLNFNRKGVFDRLDHIIDKGFEIIPYKEYIKKHLN